MKFDWYQVVFKPSVLHNGVELTDLLEAHSTTENGGTQTPYGGTQAPYGGTQAPYGGTQTPYGISQYKTIVEQEKEKDGVWGFAFRKVFQSYAL